MAHHGTNAGLDNCIGIEPRSQPAVVQIHMSSCGGFPATAPPPAAGYLRRGGASLKISSEPFLSSSLNVLAKSEACEVRRSLCSPPAQHKHMMLHQHVTCATLMSSTLDKMRVGLPEH